MTSKTMLLDHLPALVFSDDVLTALDDISSITPLCTPGPDIEGMRGLLATSRVPAELLRTQAEAPAPGDVAFVGALVQALLPRTDVVIDGDVHAARDSSVYPARGAAVVSGSLHVHGALSVSVPLVVCGDLVVDGELSDCGPQSVVVVLGSVRCRSLRTTGEVLIADRLVASSFVHGQHNDNVLEVHGTLHTPVLMSDDHAIEAGVVVVEHRPPTAGVWGADIFDMSDAHLNALLALADPTCVTAGGDIDLDRLAATPSPWRR